MSSLDTYPFGELLAALRKQRHISQHTLAASLGLHRNTIGKWERGLCLPESKTLVLELARQLRLDASDTCRLLEASLTALSPYWSVPYQRNPFFTGREAILHQLHEMLGSQQIATLSQSYTLSGLGGVGKTQTAIEYAYRYAHDYTAIAWIAAETRESIFSSFTLFGNLLHLPEQPDQDHLIAAVKQWLACHRGWLMIFDNVEDTSLLEAALPPARCGAILFTTRRQEVGASAPTLTLETMTSEEGLQLLWHRANRGNQVAFPGELSSEEAQALQEIVVNMEGLPLALDQAGAYIAATRCSFSHFWHLLQTSPLRLLAERDASADHPQSVTRTFVLAFERLQRTNAVAAELLTICAFLAPEAIPEALFSDGAAQLGPTWELTASDSFQFDAAVKACLMYSLLQRDAATQTLTIHRLVQAVLKENLSEEAKLTETVRVVRTLAQLFPSEKTRVDYWQVCERLLPHAFVYLTSDKHWDADLPERIILMTNVAAYLSNRARFAEAEVLFQRALCTWTHMLGPEHPRVADTLHGLATLYRRQGNYEQAKPLFQQALLIRERNASPEAGATLNHLALLYCQQGNYEQAEPLLQRAVRTWEQTVGPEHPEVMSALTNLATLYKVQGKYEQAEPLLHRAAHIWEQTREPEHPLSSPLNNLAELYFDQGKHKEAEALFRRVLDVREQMLGPQHPQIAETLIGLATLLSEQGHYEQAEPLYLRALSIREQHLGAEHPDTAISLNTLAELYRQEGKYKQAEPLHQRALAIREQHLGAEHSSTAQSLNNLAKLYRQEGKYEQAEPLYQRALSIYEHLLGADHPLTARSLHGLAELYQHQGKEKEAEALFRRVLQIREQSLGPEHPQVAEPLIGLAEVLSKQGYYEQAKPLYQRALVLRQQYFGTHHPEIAHSLQHLARFHHLQGHLEEALSLYQEALRVYKCTLGPHHPKTRTLCQAYADLLRTMGREEEAVTVEAQISCDKQRDE